MVTTINFWYSTDDLNVENLGADLVLNTKIADDLALIECRNEFVERYRNQVTDNIKNILPMLS